MSVNPEHELSQGIGCEGGRDDDVTPFMQHFPYEDGACVDVRGRCDILLCDDIMHAVLPVQLHLHKNEY